MEGIQNRLGFWTTWQIIQKESSVQIRLTLVVVLTKRLMSALLPFLVYFEQAKSCVFDNLELTINCY